jgi:hypothetical protein
MARAITTVAVLLRRQVVLNGARGGTRRPPSAVPKCWEAVEVLIRRECYWAPAVSHSQLLSQRSLDPPQGARWQAQCYYLRQAMTSAQQSTESLIKYMLSIALLTAFLAWFGVLFLVLFFTIIIGTVLIGVVVTLLTAGSVERLAYGLPAVCLGTTAGIMLAIASHMLYSSI